MKNLFDKITRALKRLVKSVLAPATAVAAAAGLCFCATPAHAAGKFNPVSLLTGSTVIVSNNFAFTNGQSVAVYTPNLQEQFPVGFGGGTNWWANGWSFYTNTSGVIVTNPVPVTTTNLAWLADAHWRPDKNGNNPSLGIVATFAGPDNSSTNTLTFILGQTMGTNHLTANTFTFTYKLTGGTNFCGMETNLPSTFVQGVDGCYVMVLTTDNKNTNCWLQRLMLTGWDDGGND